MHVLQLTLCHRKWTFLAFEKTQSTIDGTECFHLLYFPVFSVLPKFSSFKVRNELLFKSCVVGTLCFQFEKRFIIMWIFNHNSMLWVSFSFISSVSIWPLWWSFWLAPLLPFKTNNKKPNKHVKRNKKTPRHIFFYSTLSLAPHTLSISSSCWWSPYPEITKSVPLFVCTMTVQTRSPSSLPLDNCSNFLTVWLLLLSILYKEDFSFNFVHQWLFLTVGIQSKHSTIASEALQDLALHPTDPPLSYTRSLYSRCLLG